MIAIFGAGDMAEKGIIPLVGGEAITKAECDVTQLDQVYRVMSELMPDVVIFTAGISYPTAILDAEPETIREEINTNLLGAFHVAMEASRIGAVMIFIASVAGMHGKPNHAGYCASKSGVISLVQSLSFEGYAAYAISPGRVDTAMRERDYPQDSPGSRLEPTEIGEVVRDILAGKYESGNNIVIRRIGYETAPIVVDKGPFKEYLRVGEPVTI